MRLRSPSACSSRWVRFSNMVRPGTSSTPPVMTRPGSPPACASTAVIIPLRRICAGLCNTWHRGACSRPPKGGASQAMSKALVLLLVLGLAAATVAPAMAEPTEDAAFAAGSTSLGLLSQIAQVGDDAFSTMDLATALSCGGSPTQHYGPYASRSPDSSTCGNDWAQDTFDRHFTVRKTATTTFEVVEQFKSGSFATMAGPSPGGCDTNVGGTINSGVSSQLPSVRVLASGRGHDPSLKMSPTREPSLAVAVIARVPVEARGTDAAGNDQMVVLHVIDGFLGELEIIGSEGQPVGLPAPETLTVY